MSWLINATQLDKFRKSQKNITILDASWHLPAEDRIANDEFLASHISGSRFFDLNVFNDYESLLPNMLIRDEKGIKDKIGALGITSEHKIIFYDKSNLHSSCRALWMFKVFGHNANQLYILDGGYNAWEKYGGKTEAGESRNINPKEYHVNFQAHYIRTLVQMKNNLHYPYEQVVDVRHPVAYAGGKESRIGLRSGHIPGATNFPYFTMFEADGLWKPIDKIRKQLTGMGVDLNDPIITTSDLGITSAILNFALDLMDQDNHSLYDGSWAEWASDKLYHGESSCAERPVVTSLE